MKKLYDEFLCNLDWLIEISQSQTMYSPYITFKKIVDKIPESIVLGTGYIQVGYAEHAYDIFIRDKCIEFYFVNDICVKFYKSHTRIIRGSCIQKIEYDSSELLQFTLSVTLA
jgi:hypothetical protein